MVEALGFYVYKRFSCREEVNGSEEKTSNSHIKRHEFMPRVELYLDIVDYINSVFATVFSSSSRC